MPKGFKPEDCKKAQFGITQRDTIVFHQEVRGGLVDLCGVEPRACFVYEDRIILRNPIEIKKIIDAIEPYVRTRKRKAQIAAFRAFYAARKHLFRPYTPKPRLRKRWPGQPVGP